MSTVPIAQGLVECRVMQHTPGKSEQRAEAKQSALEALYMEDFTGGATHYHEVKSKPIWRRKMQYIGQWGNHYFYRGEYGNQHTN